MNDIALLKFGKNNLPLSTSIQFNSQKSGWISQSLALPVFLDLVKTLLVRKGMSMVSNINIWNKIGGGHATPYERCNIYLLYTSDAADE